MQEELNQLWEAMWDPVFFPFQSCLRLKGYQVSITNQQLKANPHCSSCHGKGTGLHQAGLNALKRICWVMRRSPADLPQNLLRTDGGRGKSEKWCLKWCHWLSCINASISFFSQKEGQREEEEKYSWKPWLKKTDILFSVVFRDQP